MATETVNVVIPNNLVTNAMLADMPANRIKLSVAGGDPIDGTADQASTVLDTATDPFLRTSNVPPAPVLSVNGDTGVVVLNASDVGADPAGAAAAAQAASQPLDSDLTAIAALTTTAYGRSFLELVNSAAGRTLLGLVIGTDVQAFSSVLATLTGASANGQSLITAANYAAMRTLLGLGTAALVDTGTGGTNVPTITQADARYVLQSLFDAKGDLITASADNTPIKLAAPTLLNQHLMGEPSAAGGMAWTQAEREIVIANAGITLTDQIITLQLLTPAVPGIFIHRRDLSRYTEVMLTLRVSTGSASANTPKVILRYFTSASLTASDWLDIGTSEVSVSMTSVGVPVSAWIPLAAGAITTDRYITCLISGGNSAADPVISAITAIFR